MSEERTAWGWGLASVDAAGTTLDVWYPELNLGEAPAEADRPNHNFGTLAHDEADARGIRRVPVFVVSQLDEPISNAADAYLKLHLMSMRMAKPNTLNLDGIFAQLANVVWTNYGPFAVEDFTLRKADVERASTEAALAFASQAGLSAAAPAATVNVFGVDKFPRMIDYVVPTGVRIGDADRVRLGAYLSSGTTVMHAGFVNFNAGTLGVSMVEGRVSQGVVVGDGSDIGGGAPSWAPCPVAASCAIPSASTRCSAPTPVSASLWAITAPSKPVCTSPPALRSPSGTRPSAAGEPLEVVKGAELSGKDNILFIRNSVNGRIEARYRKVGIELNAKLHKN